MATPLLEGEGILLGRPILTKASYEYVIVPRFDNIDVFVTSPPKELMQKMYTVNTSGVAKYLTSFIVARYRGFATPTRQGGLLYKAVVGGYEEVPIADLAKKFSVERHEVKIDVIDEEFLIRLAQASGTGTQHPKRFQSTPVVITVDDGGEKKPVLVNIAEAWLWLEENPAAVSEIAIIHDYKLPVIIIGEKLTRDEFAADIVSRVGESVRTFQGVLTRAVTALAEEAGGEVE